MEFEFEAEDTDIDALHGVSYQQLPSAPPSTPNSNISSPPLGNDDTAFQAQIFPHNVIDNGDSFLSGMDSKLLYSKRGPGRPRKDILPVKGILKRKTMKEMPQNAERIGQISVALSSSENSNTGFSDDKLPQTAEEPQYIEKHPGKVCCLCNLSERSTLGQGDFITWKLEADKCDLASQFYNDHDKSSNNDNLKNPVSEQAVFRRQKSVCKNKSTYDTYNELEKVGHLELIPLRTLLDGCFVYLHRMCLMWSQGVNGKLNELKISFELVIAKALMSKCFFCGQYGASVSCKMSCKKMFHLPCAVASSCFLIMENFSLFCNDHVEQVQLICPDINITCHQCSTVENISKMIMCATCGEHFHTDCVGLVDTPETRAGWNCSTCSKCQICRESDVMEGRLIKCEQCQSLYHTTCLRPIVSSLPKFGWKCHRCRVCTDCGSRTPGGGTSSRWHNHYTICDSCYQQRNKGFSCPICHKAYRAAAYKEMVKCSLCHRFVHSTCDEDADLANYHKKKEANPDYDYICPQCKLNDKFPSNTGQLRCFMETSDIISQTLEDGLLKDVDIETFQKESGEFSSTEFQASKILKKKVLFKDLQRTRGGKVIVPKSNVLSHLGKKRGSVRGKGRQLILNNVNASSTIDRASSRASDDGFSSERKILLCSAKDKFILSQDICVMCGSVGYDKEGHLIACAQCGQCYHPYCANTKLSKVILDRGWRCLDCTVCERCGQRNDEARLILCDECDLSYHIYCMSPPLDTVPHGNWKCKWCAACQKCGRYPQGINSQNRGNVLECGPCTSQVACCVCNQQYTENELIIQCRNCERWLHCRCDSIKSEEEAQICDNVEYHCILCRPKDKSLAQFLALKDNINSSKNTNNNSVLNTKVGAGYESGSSLALLHEQHDAEVTYWVDGVCMSERGANMIKALSTEIKRKRKMRVPNDSQMKESGIMAAIESVVSGSNENNGNMIEELGEGGDCPKKKDDNYKDGMVWLGGDNCPPEGFSISTNDEGISILRKKRQRNLQKLGIGGFSVRNRTFKKDSEENSLIANNITLDSDKKKKAMRKKVKSRLSEAYPIYLQEAFFGKFLLDTKSQNLCPEDSEGSDELMDVNDALFHEEKLGEGHLTTSNILKISKETVHTECKEVIEERNCKDKIANMVSHVDTKAVKVTQEIARAQKESIIGNDVAKPPNVGIHPSFIENKYKNISTDGIVGTAPFVAELPKESLGNIGNLTKEKALVDEYGRGVLKQSAELQPNNQTDFRSVPVLTQASPETHLLLKNSPHGHAQGNVSYIVQQTQPQPQQPATNQDQAPQIQILPMQLQMVNSDPVVENPMVEKPVIQQNAFTQMQKPRVATACTMSPYIAPAAQQTDSVESIVAGTQKTAEKMRRDEDLGKMATISAVLYANTQHPELKQIYPNWTDRCKQILKRWRSLSNEKKAPFLQQAKDNRSALRMRKSQQDQERICFNQKTLKEQEQERIWKQHQAKAKEAQTSLYSHRSTPYDGNIVPEGCSVEKRSVIYNTDVIQRNQQQFTSEPQSVMPDNNDTSTENKHLRTLLLNKQGNEAAWAPATTRGGFFQQPMSYDFKCNIQQQSTPKTSTFPCDDNKAQIKEVPKQMPMLNTLDMIQLEQSDVNENRQNFKQRKELKTSDTGDSELEKLDTDENGAFGDILGGLGDGNDDDLLKSLTAEIGDDFNILEYADPALDELASNQNLLTKLDFEYNDKNTV